MRFHVRQDCSVLVQEWLFVYMDLCKWLYVCRFICGQYSSGGFCIGSVTCYIGCLNCVNSDEAAR